MIYIASPYSHRDASQREERYLALCSFCAEQARRGLIVYSPILHWHPTAVRWDLPTDWDFWAQQCLPMLEKADELWVLCLPGWLNSRGVTIETTYWREVLNRGSPTLHCPNSD